MRLSARHPLKCSTRRRRLAPRGAAWCAVVGLALGLAGLVNPAPSGKGQATPGAAGAADRLSSESPVWSGDVFPDGPQALRSDGGQGMDRISQPQPCGLSVVCQQGSVKWRQAGSPSTAQAPKASVSLEVLFCSWQT